jgi:hypothetical protein
MCQYWIELDDEGGCFEFCRRQNIRTSCGGNFECKLTKGARNEDGKRADENL